MSSGDTSNRFGFRYGTIPIPNPRQIPQPSPIPEPLMINSPNPIPEPFILPTTTVLNFTFEDMNLIGWIAIDEPPHLLGGEGPSRWGIGDGPISGKAIVQTSNIWGDKADIIPLGTFLIYDLQEWDDFVMEFDMFARDNDGVGIVWGWKSRVDHFRFFTMIDPNNPAGAPPDQRAPFSMIQRRIGDNSPYYANRAMKKEASYVENQITHFKLEVINKNVKVFSNNALSLQAFTPGYTGGKVGFTLYAHTEVYFDNVKIEAISPNIMDQMTRFNVNTGQILPR